MLGQSSTSSVWSSLLWCNILAAAICHVFLQICNIKIIWLSVLAIMWCVTIPTRNRLRTPFDVCSESPFSSPIYTYHQKLLICIYLSIITIYTITLGLSPHTLFSICPLHSTITRSFSATEVIMSRDHNVRDRRQGNLPRCLSLHEWHHQPRYRFAFSPLASIRLGIITSRSRVDSLSSKTLSASQGRRRSYSQSPPQISSAHLSASTSLPSSGHVI